MCRQDVIGDHHIDVADNTYDAAVVAGAFVPGHLPLKAWDEMLRICKPGTTQRQSLDGVTTGQFTNTCLA